MRSRSSMRTLGPLLGVLDEIATQIGDAQALDTRSATLRQLAVPLGATAAFVIFAFTLHDIVDHRLTIFGLMILARLPCFWPSWMILLASIMFWTSLDLKMDLRRETETLASQLNYSPDFVIRCFDFWLHYQCDDSCHKIDEGIMRRLGVASSVPSCLFLLLLFRTFVSFVF